MKAREEIFTVMAYKEHQVLWSINYGRWRFGPKETFDLRILKIFFRFMEVFAVSFAKIFNADVKIFMTIYD